ncbi:aldo/keto reductase [Pseudoalteromonas viridis]|uniref:Aldo/keto reductase n=1 Tax=Pseudoalteromonas viridis TaxID=339617 RepID=A0ABX7V6B2_9GAMM|nr:aldo/keto reductase [Pseudoalteromonas viridis]QTL34233.1 aldo/keto reductase [Pseudoalteromonas viridis]
MKLALGTVQLGLNYGVSNISGQPSFEEAEAILALAQKSGIHCLDTAIAYGESHSVLGRLKHLTNHAQIVTKLPPFAGEQFDQQAIQVYLDYIEQSFVDLKQARLYGMLFHQASDLLKQGANQLCDALLEQKSQGNILKTGISLYGHDPISDLLLNRYVDLVQIPFNCFDTHFKHPSFVQQCKDNQIEVHARSCFLQGLLLMKPDAIPNYFSPWKKQILTFAQLAQAFKVPPSALAMAYVLREPHIDKLVVGVNSHHELEQLIAHYEIAQSLDTQNLPDLSIEDANLTNPANWQC